MCNSMGLPTPVVPLLRGAAEEHEKQRTVGTSLLGFNENFDHGALICRLFEVVKDVN